MHGFLFDLDWVGEESREEFAEIDDRVAADAECATDVFLQCCVHVECLYTHSECVVWWLRDVKHMLQVAQLSVQLLLCVL